MVLQKIDRRSKPIKKQEKLVNENLKRKRIFLEQENFDILSVLNSQEPTSQCLGRSVQQDKLIKGEAIVMQKDPRDL